MKTSLRKLRGFALLHHKQQREGDRKNVNNLPSPQLAELSQATQDMEDMRDCYDTLLSAAAATANSAYEFSQSLREMGDCLLRQTSLNDDDDDDSGQLLLMLGKLQLQLHKSLDTYRSHIFQTITIPSESLLNELRILEEMNQQCHHKRNEYENKLAARSRHAKGPTVSSQELHLAYDEYEEEATLFIFRLKSLKQGQSRSLLTQAARHHASQLSFFRKALTSLEAVEPHVKSVAEQQHIDYQFSGLEDNDNESADDDDSYDAYDDGELSFDYGQNDQAQDLSTSANSMELDQVNLTFPQVMAEVPAKENHDKNHGDAFPFIGEFRASSQSAPLLAEKKADHADMIRQMRPSSTRKLHTYVLPTPNDSKSSVSPKSDNPVSITRNASLTRHTRNRWYSSPLEPHKHGKFPGPNSHTAQSVLKERNKNITSTQLPPLANMQHEPRTYYSDTKKIKTQAFSGPLTSKPWSSRPLSGSGTLASEEKLQLFSGPLLRTPIPHSLSPPKISPTGSPLFHSTPKISELHELPRPPPVGLSSTSKFARPLVGYSAPLVSRKQEVPSANRPRASIAASPLPTPPQAVTRSFSIPSTGSPRLTEKQVSKTFEGLRRSVMFEEFASPPLTPISLPKFHRASTADTSVNKETDLKGNLSG